MNEFVHYTIEEIKNYLIRFLSDSGNDRVRAEMNSIMGEINPLEKDEYFIKMFYDYSILNMKEEIIGILESLNKLEKKDTEYDEQKNLKTIHDIAKRFLD